MQLELERVIGLTTITAAGLACNGEELAYLAGCVVVVYNVRTNCQTNFLMAPRGPKSFACVAYSGQGGKFVAAGEVCMCPTDVIVSLNLMWVMMKKKPYGMVCIHFFSLATVQCRFKLSFVDYNVTIPCPRIAVAVELALSVSEKSDHSIPPLYRKIKHRSQWCKI